MENNNQNQTNKEEVKVGFFKKAGTRIKTVGEKIPTPVKKVVKIGGIIGGAVIATAIFGKHAKCDEPEPEEEENLEEEEKEEPF